MSERTQAQKVTICVQYSKVAPTHSVSKGRYRAARASKNHLLHINLVHIIVTTSSFPQDDTHFPK